MNVVEIGGKFYQEIEPQQQRTPQVKAVKKVKRKPKPTTKYEIWAGLILMGAGLILWAISIVKQDWSSAGQDRVNNTTKNSTMRT